MTLIYVNPDCWNGKHRACAGDAWNEEADAPTSCECSCHLKPRWLEETPDGLTISDRD